MPDPNTNLTENTVNLIRDDINKLAGTQAQNILDKANAKIPVNPTPPSNYVQEVKDDVINLGPVKTQETPSLIDNTPNLFRNNIDVIAQQQADKIIQNSQRFNTLPGMSPIQARDWQSSYDQQTSTKSPYYYSGTQFIIDPLATPETDLWATFSASLHLNTVGKISDAINDIFEGPPSGILMKPRDYFSSKDFPKDVPGAGYAFTRFMTGDYPEEMDSYLFMDKLSADMARGQNALAISNASGLSQTIGGFTAEVFDPIGLIAGFATGGIAEAAFVARAASKASKLATTAQKINYFSGVGRSAAVETVSGAGFMLPSATFLNTDPTRDLSDVAIDVSQGALAGLVFGTSLRFAKNAYRIPTQNAEIKAADILKEKQRDIGSYRLYTEEKIIQVGQAPKEVIGIPGEFINMGEVKTPDVPKTPHPRETPISSEEYNSLIKPIEEQPSIYNTGLSKAEIRSLTGKNEMPGETPSTIKTPEEAFSPEALGYDNYEFQRAQFLDDIDMAKNPAETLYAKARLANFDLENEGLLQANKARGTRNIIDRLKSDLESATDPNAKANIKERIKSLEDQNKKAQQAADRLKSEADRLNAEVEEAVRANDQAIKDKLKAQAEYELEQINKAAQDQAKKASKFSKVYTAKQEFEANKAKYYEAFDRLAEEITGPREIPQQQDIVGPGINPKGDIKESIKSGIKKFFLNFQRERSTFTGSAIKGGEKVLETFFGIPENKIGEINSKKIVFKSILGVLGTIGAYYGAKKFINFSVTTPDKKGGNTTNGPVLPIESSDYVLATMLNEQDNKQIEKSKAAVRSFMTKENIAQLDAILPDSVKTKNYKLLLNQINSSRDEAVNPGLVDNLLGEITSNKKFAENLANSIAKQYVDPDHVRFIQDKLADNLRLLTPNVEKAINFASHYPIESSQGILDSIDRTINSSFFCLSEDFKKNINGYFEAVDANLNKKDSALWRSMSSELNNELGSIGTNAVSRRFGW